MKEHQIYVGMWGLSKLFPYVFPAMAPKSLRGQGCKGGVDPLRRAWIPRKLVASPASVRRQSN